MPAEGEAVVTMEESATVAAIRERAKETEATERASSRTAAVGWTCVIATGKWRAWVIRSGVSEFFFRTRVIGPAATTASNEPRVRRCSDSARMTAVGH